MSQSGQAATHGVREQTHPRDARLHRRRGWKRRIGVASPLASAALASWIGVAATVFAVPVQNISCVAVVEPCACGPGRKCANATAPRGVRTRDATHCCCAVDDPLLWSDPQAKCMEVRKCEFTCCGGGRALCGAQCCNRGDKCRNGSCSSGPRPPPPPDPRPAPSPAPGPGPGPASGRGGRHFWEFLPGPGWVSDVVEVIGLAATSLCGLRVVAPGLAQLPWRFGRRQRLRLLAPEQVARPMIAEAPEAPNSQIEAARR
mmetsp:Transcript_15982/g.43846  ORF Transcript_15982/g.43846 Transcript_15982/m.43846 type:complete len:259 (+) Transcript_15982:64-840(+)